MCRAYTLTDPTPDAATESVLQLPQNLKTTYLIKAHVHCRWTYVYIYIHMYILLQMCSKLWFRLLVSLVFQKTVDARQLHHIVPKPSKTRARET
jgi:hypothetical protein